MQFLAYPPFGCCAETADKKLPVSNVRVVMPQRADEARRVMLVMMGLDVSGNGRKLDRGHGSANVEVLLLKQARNLTSRYCTQPEARKGSLQISPDTDKAGAFLGEKLAHHLVLF
jgi:hypothetical protein